MEAELLTEVFHNLVMIWREMGGGGRALWLLTSSTNAEFVTPEVGLSLDSKATPPPGPP